MRYSFVACLLLLPACVCTAKPADDTWMRVLLDGEDLGPHEDRMYLGAKYFADHLPANTPTCLRTRPW